VVNEFFLPPPGKIKSSPKGVIKKGLPPIFEFPPNGTPPKGFRPPTRSGKKGGVFP